MYLCRFCNSQTDNFQKHRSHYKYHSNLTKDFHCGYHGCKLFFKNEQCLRMHIFRSHQVSVKQRMPYTAIIPERNTNAKFVCTDYLCRQAYENYNKFLKHLKEHMRNGLTIDCPVKNCDKKYDNVQSFTGHLSKFHRQRGKNVEDMQVEILPEPLEMENNYENDDDVYAIGHNTNEFPSGIQDDSSDESNDTNNFLINLANLYLKLESQLLVPVSTIQHLVTELSNIFNQNQQITMAILSKSLEEENISPGVIDDVKKKVLNAIPFERSNKILNTNYKRKAFYKKNTSYVPPVPVYFKIDNEEEKCFQYVPILDTLRAIFADKSLEHHFEEKISHTANVLQDFPDGTAFKNNIFFQNNPDAIQLILYQDSFEVVNPIGAAKKRYKILAIYMSLGNLPSHVRMHINSIQLVALCKEIDFDHFKVYGRIVEDLRILEQVGVEISPGNIRKGGVVFIAGDNLGSNSLGGFVENFSTSRYYCRYCLYSNPRSSNKQMRSTQKNKKKICSSRVKRIHVASLLKTKKKNPTSLKSTESGATNPVAVNAAEYVRLEYPRRTVDSYKHSLQQLASNGELTDHHGVKFNSVFNTLDSFHVCQPALPPCLGHDLMEGVVAYDFWHYIKALIKKKWFTVDKLNSEMESFQYSTHDRRDKPTKFSLTNKRILGGAWQVWCFLRLFPLFIHKYIKKPDDLTWSAVLLLIEIAELVTAPKIDMSLLPYLQGLIDEYLGVRVNVLPEVPLRAKHHFLGHYAELFVEFGPLINVWSLRFESKHTFFKRVIRNSHNFLNVTQSLAEKHELLQSLLRQGSNLRHTVSAQIESTFNLSMYADALQTVIKNANLTSELSQCSSVLIKGTNYKAGEALILRQKDYQYGVEIGKIIFILADPDSKIYFIVEKCDTIFHPILRFYELRPTNVHECFYYEQLINHTPLSIYQLGTKKGVKLQYGITV